MRTPFHPWLVAPLLALTLQASAGRAAVLPDYSGMAVTASGSPISAVRNESFLLAAPLDQDKYLETADATMTWELVSFRPLGVFQNLNVALARVVQDLEEVLAGGRSACDQNQGKLVLTRDRETGLHSDREELRWLAYLAQAGKIGEFSCERADGTSAFKLILRPAQAISLLFKPGWAWKILIIVADQAIWDSFQQRYQAYQAEVAALRNTLAPGTLVQLPRRLLPAGAAPGLEQLPGPFVCAMVVSRNDPLAQVQVRTMQLFIPINQLYPRGEDLRKAADRRKASVAFCSG